MTDANITFAGDTTGFLPDGRVVEAGRGFSWVGEGFQLFMKNPLIWVVITVLVGAIFLVLALIPFIGALAINLLLPVFTAGVMAGARSLETGGPLEINHLFAGFKQRTTELVILGALYLAASIVIGLVMVMVGGGGMITGAMMGREAGIGMAFGTMMLAVLLGLALSVPLAMAAWFATPLVAFHGVQPVEALRASFFASLKNIVPFLLFGIVLIALAFLGAITFGLGFLVIGPVVFAAAYRSYRDVFFAG